MARHTHSKKNAQRELAFPSWGGRRDGAGRPRTPDAGVSHAARVVIPRGGAPVHVTLRALDHVWNLRSRRALRVVDGVLEAMLDAPGFRVVHFTIQGNHLHAVVEADTAERLARGMQGLSIRLARGLNRMMGRSGPVWADRYHAHVLRTPREVRNALAYVLLNHRSHRARSGDDVGAGGLDPFSSAATFDGWKDAPGSPEQSRVTSPPRTWLLQTGWRRCGLLSTREVPASPGGSSTTRASARKR